MPFKDTTKISQQCVIQVIIYNRWLAFGVFRTVKLELVIKLVFNLEYSIICIV